MTIFYFLDSGTKQHISEGRAGVLNWRRQKLDLFRYFTVLSTQPLRRNVTAFYSIIFIQQYNNWIHLFIDSICCNQNCLLAEDFPFYQEKALNRSSLTQRDAPADGWMSREGIKRRKNRNAANKHTFLTLNFDLTRPHLASVMSPLQKQWLLGRRQISWNFRLMSIQIKHFHCGQNTCHLGNLELRKLWKDFHPIKEDLPKWLKFTGQLY